MMIVTEKSSVIWQSVGCATLFFGGGSSTFALSDYYCTIPFMQFGSHFGVWNVVWSDRFEIILLCHDVIACMHVHQIVDHIGITGVRLCLGEWMSISLKRKAPNLKRSDRDIIGYIALWKMIAFRKWVRLADCHLALLSRSLHLIYSACILVYPFRFCFSLISCSVGLIHF